MKNILRDFATMHGVCNTFFKHDHVNKDNYNKNEN